MRQNHTCHLWCKGIVVLVIAAALAPFACGLFAMPARMTSDHAIYALDAVRFLQGIGGFYTESVFHISSAYPVLIAPFLLLLGHASAYAFYVPHILNMLIAFAALFFFVQRLWGKETAIASLLILAIPNTLWLYSGFTHGSTVVAIAMLSLLAFVQLQQSSLKHTKVQYVLLGVLLGINMWVILSSALYVAAITALLVLSSSAWKHAYQHLRQHRILYYLWVALLYLCCSSAALALLYRGTAEWELLVWGVVALLALASVTFVIRVDAHRKQSVLHACVFIASLTIGAFPVLMQSVFAQYSPMTIVFGKGVTVQTLVPLLTTVLPKLMYMHRVPISVASSLHGTQMFTVVIPLAIMLIGVLWFFWSARHALRRLVLLAPVSNEDLRYLVMCIPTVLYIAGMVLRPTVYAGDARYGFAVLPLIVVMVACFLWHTRAIWRGLPVVLLLLLLPLFVQNWYYTYQLTNPRYVDIVYGDIQKVKTYLEEQGVTAGFSNYWATYNLGFLFGEQYSFSPFRGRIHYVGYAERAMAACRYAVFMVHPYYSIESNAKEQSILLDALANDELRSRQHREVIEKIQQSTLHDRKRIGVWDVWLLEDRTTPQCLSLLRQ